MNDWLAKKKDFLWFFIWTVSLVSAGDIQSERELQDALQFQFLSTVLSIYCRIVCFTPYIYLAVILWYCLISEYISADDNDRNLNEIQVLYGEEEEELMASSPIGSTVRTIWDDKNVENTIIIQIWEMNTIQMSDELTKKPI